MAASWKPLILNTAGLHATMPAGDTLAVPGPVTSTGMLTGATVNATGGGSGGPRGIQGSSVLATGINYVGQYELSYPNPNNDGKYRTVSLRYDGGVTYLVATSGDTTLAAAQASTSISSLRPLTWNPSTGAVGLVVDGSPLAVGGPATFSGTGSFGNAVSAVGNITVGGKSTTGAAGLFEAASATTGYVAFYGANLATRYGYVGFVGTGGSGTNINYVNENSGGHLFNGVSVAPASDNATSSGYPGYRWSVVYAASSAINTSDENTKQDVLPIDDHLLDAWEAIEWVQYRDREAVSRKGDAARVHHGLTYQRVCAALAAHPGPDGLPIDPHRYALACWDEIPAQEELWSPEQPEVPAVEARDATEAFPGIAGEVDEQDNVTVWLSPPRDAVPAIEGRPGVPAVPSVLLRPARPAHQLGGLRYQECDAVEFAMLRRRAERLEARVAALEKR